jgi:hypothetical protein
MKVTIKDRRQVTMTVSWDVPATPGGPALTGYDLRMQKMPTNSCLGWNYDTATKITFPRAPGAAGSTESIDVPDLLPENPYCFGVKTLDALGRTSGLHDSGNPGRASFNATTLAPPAGGPMNEQFGTSIDGSGDLNGDGLSDLLVGSAAGGRAYLFLGSATFAAGAPAVTFTGTSANFGASVAQIGNFDGDAFPDVAIGAYGGSRVLVYKGRMAWPAALTEAQADWEIAGDASYTSSFFGISLARLGDFNGDMVEDFAITAYGFATNQGRVVVIKGQSDARAPGASKTVIALPEGVPSRSVIIDAPPGLVEPRFGTALLGVGRFFTDGPGTTILISASGRVAATTNNEGRVYAMRMDNAGNVGLGSGAPNPLVGQARGVRIGATLANIGSVGATLSVGIGNPVDSMTVPGKTGTAFITSGTEATGPFTTRKTIHGLTNTGTVVFGGGLLVGNSIVTVSVFGDSRPDVGIASAGGGSIFLVSGETAAAAPSPIDLGTSADVSIPLPAGWMSTATNTGGLIRDLNGDGRPDFAIADVGQHPGRVIVYW